MENSHKLMIRCHPEIGKALRDGEKRVLKEIEELTGRSVSVQADPLMNIEQFDVIET
jgi:Ribonuclease G/E